LGFGTGALLAAASEGRIFGLDQQTLISTGIQLFNACLLAVALTYILYKPVRKFMQKRADGIKAQLGMAENAVEKAEELRALYEKKLEDIEQERIALIDSAYALTVEKSKQMMDEANREIAEMRERAAAAMQVERERADEEIRLHIIEVASIMAGKIVADSIDEEAHNRLFAETLSELEGRNG